MTHPSESSLALFAGGDQGLWAQWSIRRHLSRCAMCREEVKRFQATRQWLTRTADEEPGGIHWNRLAVEMRGNIRVGLAAGECVGADDTPVRLGWRTALTLVPVMLLIVIGWWLQPSPPHITGLPPEEGIVLEATPKGIQLRQDGRVLSLQHPDGGYVTYTMNVQGSLRARYVDSETGQVTINNVYAQ